MLRRTKILATLGPASDDIEIIKNLINAGLDAARINFSHGSHESHKATIEKLKVARKELNAFIPLILDTKGPEIRIKTFKDDKVFIRQGSTFTFTTDDIVGDETRVSITYYDLYKDVSVGGRILVDDGLIEFSIKKIHGTEIECVAVNSGFLGSRKGVNVPDVYVNLPSLTDQDKSDIIFGIQMGFDYIAASFVRSANDVVNIRAVLDENGGENLSIIAKIESRDGVNNLDEILEVADGIMVARGDLGVEIPPEEVPLVQKLLIRKANLIGKPVITATQMLESMVSNPRPTRAEANDVANAIFDGSDAVMLSGETAKGTYPIESVQMMSRIALKAEGSIDYGKALLSHHENSYVNITNAISYAACTTASDLKSPCIVTATNSGMTARMVAKYKPTCPIVAVSVNENTLRQLNLIWGVVPMTFAVKDSNEIFDEAAKKASETGLAKTGDAIVIVAGVPFGIAGTTNIMKVQIMGDVLVKGRGIGGQKVTGCAAVLKVADEANRVFKRGNILITPETSNKLLPYMKKASAIIIGSDKKFDSTHAETVARTLDIPLIVCSDKIIDLIPNGSMITVDSALGFVYNGIVK